MGAKTSPSMRAQAGSPTAQAKAATAQAQRRKWKMLMSRFRRRIGCYRAAYLFKIAYTHGESDALTHECDPSPYFPVGPRKYHSAAHVTSKLKSSSSNDTSLLPSLALDSCTLGYQLVEFRQLSSGVFLP